MAGHEATPLRLRSREAAGSRDARRLRRSGRVPGVVYGGGDEPLPFDADARELRQVLAGTGAVVEITFEGESGTSPVVVKDQQRHPVGGYTMHLDLLRVRLDRPIQAQVALELTGVDDAPGVKEGGVLEHVTRELTVEALPSELPDVIQHDVSAMQINDTVMLSAVAAPPRVTVLGDPEEIVVATLSPPRIEEEPEAEIEEETGVIGEEGEAPAEAEAEGESGGGDEGGE